MMFKKKWQLIESWEKYDNILYICYIYFALQIILMGMILKKHLLFNIQHEY